jgi:hypothetical protein
VFLFAPALFFLTFIKKNGSFAAGLSIAEDAGQQRQRPHCVDVDAVLRR